MVLFLLPFAIIESTTDRTLLIDIFEKVPGAGVLKNVGYGERLNTSSRPNNFRTSYTLRSLLCYTLLASNRCTTS